MSRSTVVTWPKRATGGCLLLVLVALPLLAVGCGGSPSAASPATRSISTPVHRTITPTSPAEMARFTGRAGLAFGTFHRYVYERLNGDVPKNPAQRKRAFAQASAAARAAAHEVVLAQEDAGMSTALRKLFGPMAALVPTLDGVAMALERGRSDAAGIKEANGAIANVEQTGSVGGVKIAEWTAAS